ncbi:MAG TPA: GNAT family N-acetyltransferase, partial [Bacilli bacterium]|nr:GNAT family N-acetyltransferase [Bacilli bacterium]
MTTSLQIRPLDLTDKKEAMQLLAVQIPAYRVEADLIGFDGIPPLHDTLETLQACGESFYGAFLDGELVG